MHGVPEPAEVRPRRREPRSSALRPAAVAVIGVVVFVAAMNVTALAALVHPLLALAALPIVVAAALSIVEAVSEKLAPDVASASRRCWHGVTARLDANS